MTSREDNRRLAEAYNEAMGIGDTTLPDELTDDPDDFGHNYAACQDPICPSAKPTATDTPLVRRRLTSRSAPGTRRNTLPPAGVTLVWPRDRC